MRIKAAILAALLTLTGCADREQMPVLSEALSVGTAFPIYASTTRRQSDSGVYGYGRSDALSMMQLTVSIPPSHTAGSLSYRLKRPDPAENFTIAARRDFADPADFRTQFEDRLANMDWPLREVTIFVHGYNTTFTEAAYRTAQIAYDIDLPGAVVMYSWPSRGRLFGYAYDLDSMLFARDGLENTIRQVKAAGAERIILVGHSMGAALVMETLRQADLRSPGWSARTLNGGVILISPDLDVDLFDTQIASLSQVPQPFGIMSSSKDSVLDISAWLRGTNKGERLGNLTTGDRLAHWPIELIDMTTYNNDAGSAHFVAATSPSFLTLIRSMTRVETTLDGTDHDVLSQLIPKTREVIRFEEDFLSRRAAERQLHSQMR